MNSFATSVDATKKLLGQASTQTTGGVYADQLAETMRIVLEGEK